MREYETIVIVDPTVTEDYLKDLDQRVVKLVQKYKGHLFFARPWGKRTFAYPIAKKKEGYYIHYDYSANVEMVAELERILRIDEKILRFLSVLITKEVDMDARKKEVDSKLEVANA